MSGWPSCSRVRGWKIKGRPWEADVRRMEMFQHQGNLFNGILAAPPKATPPSNKGLIAGLIKGNQWLINPYMIRPAIS